MTPEEYAADHDYQRRLAKAHLCKIVIEANLDLFLPESARYARTPMGAVPIEVQMDVSPMRDGESPIYTIPGRRIDVWRARDIAQPIIDRVSP